MGWLEEFRDFLDVVREAEERGRRTREGTIHGNRFDLDYEYSVEVGLDDSVKEEVPEDGRVVLEGKEGIHVDVIDLDGEIVVVADTASGGSDIDFEVDGGKLTIFSDGGKNPRTVYLPGRDYELVGSSTKNGIMEVRLREL